MWLSPNKYVYGVEREWRWALCQSTELKEDGFWNEVGNMKVTAKHKKRNEKWSRGVFPWDRAEIMQTNLTRIINTLVLIVKVPR